jgi:hypothetical protein
MRTNTFGSIEARAHNLGLAIVQLQLKCTPSSVIDQGGSAIGRFPPKSICMMDGWRAMNDEMTTKEKMTL